MEFSISRALVLVLAVAAATLAFSAGQAVVAAADAQAQVYCGAYKDGTARTSTRFGRVRSRSCLEKSPYGYTRSVQQAKVDKPSGCFCRTEWMRTIAAIAAISSASFALPRSRSVCSSSYA